MSRATILYMARPATERRAWRITNEGRLVSEHVGREEAIGYAAAWARMREAAGDAVFVKLERVDGTWVTCLAATQQSADDCGVTA